MHLKGGIMKNTEDQTSHFGNTRKGYQGTQVTYETVLNLLQVNDLPFLDEQWMKDLATKGTERMLNEYGPQWIRDNKIRLVEELEQISDM